MDSSCAQTFQPEDETRVLGALLDAFHPLRSLEEIASAYCRAGNDLCKAGEILCQPQEGNSNIVGHRNDIDISTSQPVEQACKDSASNSGPLCNNSGSMPKKISATVGSISTILGKAYARPSSFKKERKADENSDFKDMEHFLFSMLGDDSGISRDVVREVLGLCQYDVKKAMEELLAIPTRALDKRKKIDQDISEKYVVTPNSGVCQEEKHKNSPDTLRNSTKLANLGQERSDLPRELLVSLFNAPDIFDEEPNKHLEWGLNRTRVHGQKVVRKPLDDMVFKPLSVMANIQPDFEDVIDENDTYMILRQDAKEHRDKMKKLYEAAIEAYASGNRSEANDLLEEGRHHHQLAREADEKYAAEILETKKNDTQNDVPLDLHAQDTRDSIRLLKKHLLSLADIPMFRYLKVTVNTDAEDLTKGKRNRMVIKLLERENIRWIEEDGNPGTLCIPLNEIDKSKLTFANNLQ